jgi:DNA-binding XRE family transcriptional regulator
MLGNIYCSGNFYFPLSPNYCHKPLNTREDLKMLEYDRKRLGQFLKDTREDAALTQAEVSNRLGYTSPQFISNIERGISVAPLKTLARMVNLYKASPDTVVRIILDSQKKMLRDKLMRSK